MGDDSLTGCKVWNRCCEGELLLLFQLSTTNGSISGHIHEHMACLVIINCKDEMKCISQQKRMWKCESRKEIELPDTWETFELMTFRSRTNYHWFGETFELMWQRGRRRQLRLGCFESVGRFREGACFVLRRVGIEKWGLCGLSSPFTAERISHKQTVMYDLPNKQYIPFIPLGQYQTAPKCFFLEEGSLSCIGKTRTFFEELFHLGP